MTLNRYKCVLLDVSGAEHVRLEYAHGPIEAAQQALLNHNGSEPDKPLKRLLSVGPPDDELASAAAGQVGLVSAAVARVLAPREKP